MSEQENLTLMSRMALLKAAVDAAYDYILHNTVLTFEQVNSPRLQRIKTAHEFFPTFVNLLDRFSSEHNVPAAGLDVSTLERIAPSDSDEVLKAVGASLSRFQYVCSHYRSSSSAFREFEGCLANFLKLVKEEK